LSQNIVALIIFLVLIALAVIGTLLFSALVDRGERKRRSKVTRHRENDRNRAKDASQSGSSGDDSGGEREEPVMRRVRGEEPGAGSR
jgi:FtsZ-interacting cell division protein ZipA